MKKPHKCRTTGALDDILAQKLEPQPQVIVNRFTKITEFIQEQRLTDTLQALKTGGYEGDAALFLIVLIQNQIRGES